MNKYLEKIAEDSDRVGFAKGTAKVIGGGVGGGLVGGLVGSLLSGSGRYGRRAGELVRRGGAHAGMVYGAYRGVKNELKDIRERNGVTD